MSMTTDIIRIITEDISSFVEGYRLSASDTADINPIVAAVFSTIRNFFIVYYFAGLTAPISFLLLP